VPALKNERWELFAQGLATGMPQCEAYAEAGYNRPSDGSASRLAKKAQVSSRVAELNSRKASRIVLTRNYILEAAIENAEKALGRRPVKISRKVGDKYEQTEVYLYEGQVANAALKMLGSELNMFVDRKDVRIVNEFDKLTDQELADELSRAARLLLESDGKVIEHEDE
jgi:hypothetical protein